MKKSTLNIIVVSLIALFLMFRLIYVRDPFKSAKLHETMIEFDNTELDLGNLRQGKPQPGTFTFTNTGDTPFVITNVATSCGCTTPEWPRHPIKPGKTGEIKVTYDAQHTGRFTKTIRVEGNVAGGFMTLSIRGEVQANESNQSDQAP